MGKDDDSVHPSGGERLEHVIIMGGGLLEKEEKECNRLLIESMFPHIERNRGPGWFRRGGADKLLQKGKESVYVTTAKKNGGNRKKSTLRYTGGEEMESACVLEEEQGLGIIQMITGGGGKNAG